MKIKIIVRQIMRQIKIFSQDFGEFLRQYFNYLFKKLHITFIKFDSAKSVAASVLYKQRGKNARRFIHTGMAGLSALGVLIAPVIAEDYPAGQNWDIPTATSVVSASTDDLTTMISEKARDKIIEYTVKEGDTVASIAQTYGISKDTVLWQNDLTEKDKIKVGQKLQILPVSGISHKVQKGDTVYSIAKKYDTVAQGVVDFPFNTFVNDETFELAIGQIIIVPDGVMPKAVQTTPRIRRITPDAGTVVASGNFVWPASGNLTQFFAWYHKGLDIANNASPNILAADSGKVIIAGWPDGYGYGNRVMIDHGNGYKTLYAHLSSIYVVPGQSVNRGDAIGKMGTTGRSTGIHLHFEVIKNGVYLNPLTVLQ